MSGKDSGHIFVDVVAVSFNITKIKDATLRQHVANIIQYLWRDELRDYQSQFNEGSDEEASDEAAIEAARDEAEGN